MRDEIKPLIDLLEIDDSIKVAITTMLKVRVDKPRMTKLAPIYNALFPSVTDAVKAAYSDTHDPAEWTNYADYAIYDIGIKGISPIVKRDIIQCAVTYYLMDIVGKVEDLERWNKLGEL